MAADIAAQVQSVLRTQTFPVPSRTWLAGIVSARNPAPPIASLMATARVRLLAADLTEAGLLDEAYNNAHALPRETANNAEVVSAVLPHDVIVQVLEIENIARSRMEQVEELEAIERGEQTRGREIVRLPDVEDDEDADGNPASIAATAPGTAPVYGPLTPRQAQAVHKLILQDGTGQTVWGTELKRIDRIGIGKTNLGEKWILKKGSQLSRGLIMLEPTKVQILGGRVEVWHTTWVETRLEALKEGLAELNMGN